MAVAKSVRGYLLLPAMSGMLATGALSRACSPHRERARVAEPEQPARPADVAGGIAPD